jgi:hypothetical protein
MGNVSDVRVPGSFYFVLLVALLLGVLGFYYFFVQGDNLPFSLRKRSQTLKEAQLKIRVWVNK